MYMHIYHAFVCEFAQCSLYPRPFLYTRYYHQPALSCRFFGLSKSKVYGRVDFFSWLCWRTWVKRGPETSTVYLDRIGIPRLDHDDDDDAAASSLWAWFLALYCCSMLLVVHPKNAALPCLMRPRDSFWIELYECDWVFFLHCMNTDINTTADEQMLYFYVLLQLQE